MADVFTPKTINAAGQFAWSNLANWSTGLVPDQNTAATLNSTAAGYTLLVDNAYTVNQVAFGSGAGSLNLTITGSSRLTAGNGAVVAAGSTVTIAAGSTGALTTNGTGLEVQAGATFNVNGGTFSSLSSGLTLDDGATATFGAGVTFNVNTLNLNGSSKLTLDIGSVGAPHIISNVNDTSANSTLNVSGGDLQLGSGGGGTYAVSNGGVIEFTGSLGSNATLALNGGSILLDNNTNLQSGTSFAFSSKPSTLDIVSANNYQNGFGYAVTGFDYGDKLQFGTLNLTGDSYVYAGTTLTISSGGTQVLKLTSLALAADAASVHSFTLSGNTITLACFLSGTLIETADGPMPVEMLRAGQQVTTIEQGGRVARPLRWVGSRTIDAADIPDDEDAYPVRIRAGAFAPDQPLRDLLVTGEHGIHVGGGLIPARMLVNGRSILRDTGIARYIVHHVELDTHAILLAEGLPVESYLDTGNRASFDAAESPASGRPWPRRARRSWRGDAAAPLTVGREAVEPVWRALSQRADRLGLAPLPELSLSGEPGLGVLLAGGQVLLPRWRSGERHWFHLPDGARPLRLLSRSARPSEVIGPFVDDRRRLGVGVSRITLWNGLTDTVLQASELSGAGWHELEDGRRWTDGEATLSMPAATGPDSFLEVQLGARTQYRTGPAPADRLAA